MKNVVIVLLFIIILALAGFIGIYFVFNSLNSNNEEVVQIEIIEGEGTDQISNKLKSEQLIRSKFLFKAYLFINGDHNSIMPGRYEFESVNAKKIADIITNKTPQDKEISITVVEGWTIEDIADKLAEENLVEKANFMAVANTVDSRDIIPDTSYDFLEGKSKNHGLEGFLFPDTYRFYKDTTSEEIVGKMLDNFDFKVYQDLKQDFNKSEMTVWEVVTLASIVEKEVRTKNDRRIAAGVFLSRLEIDKPLQSDATINYVTGKGTTMPSLDDLGAESKYNTYLYPGLPPSPICNPSLESIEAVLDPIASEFLYFLTKPDGTTVFSKTYDEHLANKYNNYPDTRP